MRAMKCIPENRDKILADIKTFEKNDNLYGLSFSVDDFGDIEAMRGPNGFLGYSRPRVPETIESLLQTNTNLGSFYVHKFPKEDEGSPETWYYVSEAYLTENYDLLEPDENGWVSGVRKNRS